MVHVVWLLPRSVGTAKGGKDDQMGKEGLKDPPKKALDRLLYLYVGC